MVNDAETYWLNAAQDQKLWVLREAGWRTNGGTPTRTALSASRKRWEDLSPAMRNVLTDRARKGFI